MDKSSTVNKSRTIIWNMFDVCKKLLLFDLLCRRLVRPPDFDAQGSILKWPISVISETYSNSEWLENVDRWHESKDKDRYLVINTKRHTAPFIKTFNLKVTMKFNTRKIQNLLSKNNNIGHRENGWSFSVLWY